MRNLRKTIFSLVIVTIIALLITSSFGMSITVSKDLTSSKIKINKINTEPECISTNSQQVNTDMTTNRGTKGANFAFAGLHPGFGRNDEGTIVAAHYTVDVDNIVWTFSTNDGTTFDDGMYWDVGGDYPSIKLWQGQRFFGTFVTDYLDSSGGKTYLFESTDPTNYDTYRLVHWNWTFNGWHDMIDADIACDNSQNTWEWGVSSYVMSKTYDENIPTIVYSDEQMETNAFISWYNYNGCAHTDVDIDPTTHYAYCVYDWFNESSWKLLVRVIDFASIETGFNAIYEINGLGNLKNPAVAAYGNKVVILAQTDENGNDDIICLYTDDKFVTIQTSFIVDTTENEMYPDVRFNKDGNFVCTYVMNNHQYALESDDGGATWMEPGRQIITNDVIFIEEYKTSDLGDLAVKEMWEVYGVEGAEIWIGEVAPFWNLPPYKPTIEGPSNGEINIQYNFTLNIIEPERDNVYYYIDWSDENESGWIGPYAYGQTITATHAWSKPKIYEIRIKVKDTFGAESNWSEPFTMYITEKVFLIGLIQNVNKSEGVTIFNMTRGIIVKFNPIVVKKCSSVPILILNNNSLGYVGIRFIIGKFYAIIQSEQSFTIHCFGERLFNNLDLNYKNQ